MQIMWQIIVKICLHFLMAASVMKGSAATIPTLSTELNSGIDEAADKQQDWLLFDGDVNELLSSCPPTYLKQPWCKKTSQSALPKNYEYCCCQCGCAYKFSICILYDLSSHVELIHYKEVTVSLCCYVMCFVILFVF
jgi:hypothetical protein